MVMDEKRLRELVIKAMESIMSESSQNEFIPKKKLYVILTEEWNGVYWRFFEKLNEQSEYEAYAVITRNINNNIHLNNLKKFRVCKGIIDEKDIDFDEMPEYTTIFPIVSRNIVVKTALCIDDTFETNWIFKSMEKGQRIIFLKSGLQKFSGKEPVSYRNKILDYFRTLLEFDIEISECINLRENNELSEDRKSTLLSSSELNNNVNLNESKSSCTKNIITEKEIGSYVHNNKIILNEGDIITDMAREKARSLNISLIKR